MEEKESLHCPRCGREANENTDSFCEGCGEDLRPLHDVCEHCGHGLYGLHTRCNYCPMCGGKTKKQG